MKRTQIYIDEEIFSLLESESRTEKKTISEIIRDSIKEKYNYRSNLIRKKLETAFGIWKSKKFDTDEYIRTLRKDR